MLPRQSGLNHILKGTQIYQWKLSFYHPIIYAIFNNQHKSMNRNGKDNKL